MFSSVCSFKRVRADVGSVLQDLLGDLLNVGIVVLRRVWKGLRQEFTEKANVNLLNRSHNILICLNPDR